MKKYLNKVTITGASDDTSLQDMLQIQKEYPFVEWGILLSANLAGKSKRFPSFQWINELEQFQNETNNSLKLSGHLCGTFVDRFLQKKITRFSPDSVISSLYSIITSNLFGRIQVNTHGEPHKYNQENLIYNINLNPNVEYISQFDKINDYIFFLQQRNIENISALYDLSHGAGVLPEKWDAPLQNIKTGYAGGLSPENIKQQLDILENVVEDKIVWVDVETMVRTDEYLDLEKTRKFLDGCVDHVITS